MMEKSILLDLKSTEILSELSVKRLKQYILRKYPGEDNKKQSLVFADAVKRIVSSKIPECGAHANEQLKMGIIKNALKKSTFSVDCSDVFFSVLEAKWQEDDLLDNFAKWVNTVLNTDIPTEKVKKLVSDVYCILDENPDLDIEAIIQNIDSAEDWNDETEEIIETEADEEAVFEEASDNGEFEEQNVVWGIFKSNTINETEDVEETYEINDVGQISKFEETSEIEETSGIEETSKIEETSEIEEASEIDGEGISEINENEEFEESGLISETDEICGIYESNEISNINVINEFRKIEEIIDIDNRTDKIWKIKELISLNHVKKSAVLLCLICLILLCSAGIYWLGRISVDVKEPKTRIVERVEQIVLNDSIVARKLNMRATAYDLSFESCKKNRDDPEYGITYSGRKAVLGRTVAVDPNTIPLESELYIVFPKEYSQMNGIYVAEDIGSAVKGDIIDIFLGEDKVGENAISQKVKEFGVRNVEVYVLK